MYQPLSLFIGLRYSQSKRRNQYISFVSLISLLGMVLGVIALIVVLSVMNGFESEMRGRILAVVPHGYIEGPEGRLSDWQQWADQLQQHNTVTGVAPYIKGNIMLSRPGTVRGAQLHAIDPDREKGVSKISSSMVAGDLNDLRAGSYNIVMGKLLARFLGVYVGDDISVILPRVTVTPFGVFPRVKRFHVVGVFEVGAQLDSSTVFIHLSDGQKLFQLGNAVMGLRVQIYDLFKAAEDIPRLLSEMPEGAIATHWSQTQGSLFQAVKMEKRMVSLLLLIIVAIAAFNIVSILTIMVADKRSDIAVLRTMGASPSSIMSVFIIQGLSVGIAGIVFGLLLGIPIAIYVGEIVSTFESLLGAQVFNPQVFFISRIPSVLKWEDIVLISGCALVLSALATLYPAWRASQIQPAEVLRYD
ncbi:MAG: lipoprotein-releasing ABC transporter permease subunit [Spongiibacteraceae bacterium]|nr:lipoprotein-releasing ABC transporter permease subunit [Spongiibacteraceae bacterium]